MIVSSNRVVLVKMEKNRLRFILEVKSGRLNDRLEGKGRRRDLG